MQVRFRLIPEEAPHDVSSRHGKISGDAYSLRLLSNMVLDTVIIDEKGKVASNLLAPLDEMSLAETSA